MLGHDVFYIEDTRQYPIFQSEAKLWDDASLGVQYLKDVIGGYGLGNRWAYRDIASGNFFGMSEQMILD